MSLETTIINVSLDIISPKSRHYHLLQYNQYEMNKNIL